LKYQIPKRFHIRKRFHFSGQKRFSKPQRCNPCAYTNKLFSESPDAKVPVSGNGPTGFPGHGRPAKSRFLPRERRLLCTIRCPKSAPDILLAEHGVKILKHR